MMLTEASERYVGDSLLLILITPTMLNTFVDETKREAYLKGL